ncbi:hypothetical protein Cni_G17533 [Canna indica]|uniref:Uncharacterized protein n=1 Tax=Canna indica TaxID=4628 RepID=A0AAQ3KJE1_9LILI|nr:hypothetical protein Cni_G17533 [Canna indica]
MWGEGGRFYWGRSEGEGRREAKGIAVLFAWIPSQESDMKSYVDLYWSLGWRPLVCHVDFLTIFLPDKATSLARGVLDELSKVTKIRQLPIVLVSFSLGSKGCMDKVLQILDGKWQGGHELGEYRLLRDCICGQIYDSSPVDFTCELASRFSFHPTAQRLFRPTRIASWMAKTLLSGLDTVFPSRFEAHREEYWRTLYSSVNMGPFLIFCSEDDDLASYQIIFNFAQHLQELGGDVRLVKWSSSAHLGHYRHHQTDYHSNVVEMLNKAFTCFSQKRRRNACDNISKSVYSLHEVAQSSNESLKRVAIGPNDHFYLPSSSDNSDGREGSSSQDEQKGKSFTLPSINPQGVLSQILFDVCVPKNVEGWDIKPVMSFKGKQTFGSARHDSPMNYGRFIRRSRL